MDENYFRSKFSWISYIEKYPDLKNANINSEDKAWSHVNNFGLKENRDIFNGNKEIQAKYQEFKKSINEKKSEVPVKKFKKITDDKILKLLKGKTIKRVLLLKTLHKFLENYFPVILEDDIVDNIDMLSKSKRNLATHSLSFEKKDTELVRETVLTVMNKILKIKLLT